MAPKAPDDERPDRRQNDGAKLLSGLARTILSYSCATATEAGYAAKMRDSAHLSM